MTTQDKIIDATATDRGRVRQLIVTLILAALLTAGLFLYVVYGVAEKVTVEPLVYGIYVAGIVILGINYINDNVLLQLVMRIPLPGKLVGK